MGATLWTRLIVVGVSFMCVHPVRAQTVDPMFRTAKDYFEDVRIRELADAARRGKVEAIDRLISMGVPVDGLGMNRWTPLAWALHNYSLEGVRSLLRHGANPNHRIYKDGYVTDMPLVMLIAGSRMPELLEAMLNAGASPDARYGVPGGDGDPVRYPYEGESLLIEGVLDPELVRIMLKHGATVDLCVHSRPSSFGWTAAEAAASGGHWESLRLLLEAGASVRLDGVAWWLQARPWPEAAEPRRVEMLKLLRKRGAKIYRSATNPQTPKALLTPGPWGPTECESDTVVDLTNARSLGE